MTNTDYLKLFFPNPSYETSEAVFDLLLSESFGMCCQKLQQQPSPTEFDKFKVADITGDSIMSINFCLNMHQSSSTYIDRLINLKGEALPFCTLSKADIDSSNETLDAFQVTGTVPDTLYKTVLFKLLNTVRALSQDNHSSALTFLDSSISALMVMKDRVRQMVVDKK